jgi:hypothetical protein
MYVASARLATVAVSAAPLHSRRQGNVAAATRLRTPEPEDR